MKQFRRRLAVPAYLVLILCAMIWLAPISLTLIKSFSINGIGNYIYVLTYKKIRYFQVVLNSMSIAAGTALIVTLISSLAGFAFSKLRLPGGKILYGAILACLAVPVAAVTSPLFATIKTMGLLDKRLGCILPLVAFNAPMMLMMIKNYFDGIPNELIESATIDGAGKLRVWAQLMVPLSLPILANVLVLTFIYSWNDYLVPLLVMRSESSYTVTLAAQYFMSSTFQSPADVARIYAVMMLLTLPSILVYLFSQKWLVSGLTAGAVKG
jgi:raffinose/stachyose/melibiose transport system permease protein